MRIRTVRHMLFGFRLIFSTLLLILVQLLLPDFIIGAKYHILFESIITASFIQLIRIGYSNRLEPRMRGFIGGTGMVAGLVLARVLFHGVRLTVPGILFSYFGVVFMEILLPDETEYSWVKDEGGR